MVFIQEILNELLIYIVSSVLSLVLCRRHNGPLTSEDIEHCCLLNKSQKVRG